MHVLYGLSKLSSPWKSKYTAHLETDYISLFISVIEICGSLFSLWSEFQARLIHSIQEGFLRMDSWSTFISCLICLCLFHPLKPVIFNFLLYSNYQIYLCTDFKGAFWGLMSNQVPFSLYFWNVRSYSFHWNL